MTDCLENEGSKAGDLLKVHFRTSMVEKLYSCLIKGQKITMFKANIADYAFAVVNGDIGAYHAALSSDYLG